MKDLGKKKIISILEGYIDLKNDFTLANLLQN